MTRGARVVVGVGNRMRRDDAAGLEVAALVRRHAPADVEIRELESEATGLVDLVDRARLVIVADAAAGDTPGRVHRFDAATGPVPAALGGSSTHGLGPGDAIELARLLGRLHARVIVYAIGGAAFGPGEGLSRGVAEGVARAAEAIVRDLAAADRSMSIRRETSDA